MPDYDLEEYKHINNAIFDMDKRILQVFGVTIIVVASLIAAVGKVFFEQYLQNSGNIKILSCSLAYLSFLPYLILIPSFYLIIGIRVDMMRLGSYRLIFFEKKAKRSGWESRLKKLRTYSLPESLDSIPLTYWALFLGAAILFIFAVLKASGCWLNYFLLIIPTIATGFAHYKWKRAISVDLNQFIEKWDSILRAENDNTT